MPDDHDETPGFGERVHDFVDEKRKRNGHDKNPRALVGIGWEQINEAPRSNWLIKHVLACGAVSAWAGPPGSGKSALLIDIGVHLATGEKDWRGYRVKRQAGVIYLALERDFLVRQRVAAYKIREAMPLHAPFRVYRQLVNVMDPAFAPTLLDTIAQFEDDYSIGVGLVIMDTHAKALAAGGGDENNPKDQNVAANNVRRVLGQRELHFASIGHTGKDPTRGERGTNARQADIDMENIIEIDGSTRTVRITKANSRALGDLTAFSLEPVELGLDEDGDMETTALVSPVLMQPQAPKPKAEAARAESFRSLLRQALVRTYWRIADDIGKPKTGRDGKLVKAILTEDLRRDLIDQGRLEIDEKGHVTSSSRNHWCIVRAELAKAGTLIENKGMIWAP